MKTLDFVRAGARSLLGLALTLVAFPMVGWAAPARPEATPAASVITYTTQQMNTYDLITLGDFSSSSDVEGRSLIGRDLVNTTSSNFAIHLSLASNQDTVVIVRNIAANGNPLNVNSGSLRLGGNRNGRAINFNGGAGAGLVADAALSNTLLSSQLITASTQLGQTPANNAVTLPTTGNNPVTFNVSSVNSCGVAIFNVSAEALFDNSHIQQIDVNFNRASTVLINVTGSTADWSHGGNLVGNFNNTTVESHLLWNFPQATNINLRSHNLRGAILAPLAAVTTQANIDGSTAVQSLTTTSEIHQPEFAGSLSCTGTTAVTLLSMQAEPTAWQGAAIAWQTAQEVNTLGFNVWRSAEANARYQKVNASLIPAQNSMDGSSYSFRDATAPAGTSSFYKLETVDTDGTSTWSQPVSVQTRHLSFMPMSQR